MILLTGATGTIGGLLAHRLAADGVPFRALVRREGVTIPGAEVVVGDLDDPATLPEAFAGVGQLFLNTAGPYPDEEPVIAQQFAAIDAAVAAGVEHVVKISTAGARADGPMPLGTHAKIEARLAGSGLAGTVLRPNTVMQNLVRGIAIFTPDGDLFEPFGGKVAHVDARDVADCAFAVLTGSAPRGGTHDLTGPLALTAAELTTALSTALDRRIGLVQPGLDELEPILLGRGMPESYVKHFVELARLVGAGLLADVTTAVTDLTGNPPRSLDAFIAEHRDRLRGVPAPSFWA
ncbi:NmrA family NAD(P)-binding protein [Umezawaea beigongshangensis]|uniref:NmrA family NAD(P)-binding protein n=1 Tax=Umezawaea beigongshangensis TaxID=2780383 RepID=UPI0018F259C5|nr:NAD(P)H-binding protein [Umezawaea beigongshangensis]